MSTGVVELHDADRAQHPDVAHAGQLARGRQPGRQSGRDACDLALPVLGEQQVDRRAATTAAASGLPMNVGPCARIGTSPLLMPSATRDVHSVAAIVR